MMNALQIVDDPADFGFPPGLPVELALREHPVADICATYGLSQADWLRLRANPLFLDALQNAVDMLKKEGASFKLKARIQAEALLKTNWDLIHAPFEDVPAHVKSDLLRYTIRVAGYDASYDQKAVAQQAAAHQSNNVQVNIHLND